MYGKEEFNLNDYVYFNLTEKGEEIIEHHIQYLSHLMDGEQIQREHVIKTDENGMEYMQLWYFMKLFGSHMFNGANPVVEGNKVYFD